MVLDQLFAHLPVARGVLVAVVEEGAERGTDVREAVLFGEQALAFVGAAADDNLRWKSR